MFDPVTLGLTALSMGGSLLSGLGAKQASAKQARLQMIADAMAQQKNEETLARVNARREEIGNTLLDARNVVKTAEMAGFNPVTWINGGGLGYMTDAAKFLVPEYSLVQASQVPQQHSALSAWGGAISAGANMFGTMYRAEQSYNLQQQKLNNAQDALFFGLSQSNAMRGITSYGAGGMSTASRGATGAAGVSAQPYMKDWERGDVKVTNPYASGFVDPRISDTDTKETRLGEPGDWLFGLDTMVHDAVRNVTGRTIREWGQAAGVSLAEYQKGSNSMAGTIYNWFNAPNSIWNRALTGTGTVKPFVPAGMSPDLAYPTWVKP